MSDKNSFFPLEIVAIVGEKVEFLCLSEEPVVWLFNGESLPDDVIVEDSEQSNKHWLKIESVELSHDGIYSCYESLPSNIPIRLLGEGELTVQSNSCCK